MTLDMNVSSIVSINISEQKGSENDLPLRIITLVDKDGREHTINVFGLLSANDLPISL